MPLSLHPPPRFIEPHSPLSRRIDQSCRLEVKDFFWAAAKQIVDPSVCLPSIDWGIGKDPAMPTSTCTLSAATPTHAMSQRRPRPIASNGPDTRFRGGSRTGFMIIGKSKRKPVQGRTRGWWMKYLISYCGWIDAYFNVTILHTYIASCSFFDPECPPADRFL